MLTSLNGNSSETLTPKMLIDPVKIGQGGQKVVYRAIDHSGRTVVLKEFLDKAIDERGVREIGAVQIIDSARIPRILAWGTQKPGDGSESLWVIEEFLAAENLRQRVSRSFLSVLEIYSVALHVLDAIQAAEKVRIVHRDIKPENILFDDLTKSAWLIDFGIARHLEMTSLTATLNAFGPCTFGYAAPEQLKNEKEKIDSRADLFSLGVTLYELLTGVNPLIKDANGPLDVISRTMNSPLPRIDSPNVKPQFSALVHAMSRPRRDQRLPDASEAFEWMKEIYKAGV